MVIFCTTHELNWECRTFLWQPSKYNNTWRFHSTLPSGTFLRHQHVRLAFLTHKLFVFPFTFLYQKTSCSTTTKTHEAVVNEILKRQTMWWKSKTRHQQEVLEGWKLGARDAVVCVRKEGNKWKRQHDGRLGDDGNPRGRQANSANYRLGNSNNTATVGYTIAARIALHPLRMFLCLRLNA